MAADTLGGSRLSSRSVHSSIGVLRIGLAVPKRTGVVRLIVEGRITRGRSTVRWAYLGCGRGARLADTRTYVLRHRMATASFKPVDASDPDATRVVEIVAQLSSGRTFSRATPHGIRTLTSGRTLPGPVG